MENETAQILPSAISSETTAEKNIGATENRLLQAMSINDSLTDSQPTELPEFIAYAGTELKAQENKAKVIS